VKIKIKKLHPQAIIPSYAKPGDAGLDLTAVSQYFETNQAGCELVVYGTGLALEIPEGYVGLIFPRSSISKTSLSLANCVGVIDSGYRGEILLKFRTDTNAGHYTIGDRIGQLLIISYPQIEFAEVSELSNSIRSDGGFGSSGQ
jgi:dUTP pyrophosphatase